MSAYSVTELREAWRAVEAGQYAPGAPRRTLAATSNSNQWMPSVAERVVAVVGCAGGVGASTVAVALATATGIPARVVECCPPLGSGLSAAANAELGVDGGWRRGSRGPVLLERRTGVGRVVPVPASSSVEWTILDAGWTALVTPGVPWLLSLLRTLDQVVLVTNATVPGLRRLESCADFFEGDVLGVVVGPAAKRWPRLVKVAAAGMPSPLRLVDFPLDRRLQVTGLTPAALPAPLLNAAQNVLALVRKEPT
jgi:hypothetical protein